MPSNDRMATRYEFCDFSKIYGFPNIVPNREVWEHYLPKSRGKDYDHPSEHLLDFHECMHKLNIDHEDVLIKMFRFSLEGHAREWCRTLPVVSIQSLNDFHIAFNNHCKQGYGNDLLYEECCMAFEILYRKCVNIKYQSAGNQEIIEHEIVPHDLQQGFNHFQTDLFSQESGVHANNQVFEVSSAVIFLIVMDLKICLL